MNDLQENENFRDIGGRLRVFRGILGLSQGQLANASDTTIDDIEQIEKGEINADIFFPFIFVLKRDFGLCIDWLFSGKGQPFTFQGPKTPLEVYENSRAVSLFFLPTRASSKWNN